MNTAPGIHAGGLYLDERRVRQRSESLRAAKVSGDSPIDTLLELLRGRVPVKPTLLEVGPGRGTLLARLADQLPGAGLAAADRSSAMLDAAAARVGPGRAAFRQADMHCLPYADRQFDGVITSFVLYHSREPRRACSELLRVCRPDGVLLATTKSAASYSALDELIARSGVDPEATDRPSLYAAFSSENAEGHCSSVGQVLDRRDVLHRFRFETPLAAARYAVTVAKYRCHGDLPEAVGERLARHWPPGGLAMDSTVTYLVVQPAARRP